MECVWLATALVAVGCTGIATCEAHNGSELTETAVLLGRQDCPKAVASHAHSKAFGSCLGDRPDFTQSRSIEFGYFFGSFASSSSSLKRTLTMYGGSPFVQWP